MTERKPGSTPQSAQEGQNRKLGLKDRISGFIRKRDLRTQGYILAAIDSLNVEGVEGVSGYQIAKRDASLRHPNNPRWHMMGLGSVYRNLNILVESRQLNEARIEIPGEPARFVYYRIQDPSSHT